MEQGRRRTLIRRWSLITAAGIALFWTVWWLVTGEVPVVTAVRMTPDWSIELPFAVSRWFDVLIAPLWSSAVILLFTSKVEDKDDWTFGLVVGLVSGLVIGLAAGLVVGLISGLVIGLVVGLGVGLTYGLVFGLAYGLAVGLAVGLAYGLAVGLAVGLAYGLVYGLVAGLGVGLVIGLTYGLVSVLSKVFTLSLWKGIGRWLTAT